MKKIAVLAMLMLIVQALLFGAAGTAAFVEPRCPRSFGVVVARYLASRVLRIQVEKNDDQAQSECKGI